MHVPVIIGMLVCFAFCGTVSAQNSAPNGGFETWDSASIQTPQYYPYSSNVKDFFYQSNFSVVKVGSAYHGNSAVQLTTNASIAEDTNTGFFANINPTGGNPLTWHGGMPYNQKPTGIRGWYKNNEMTGDSGSVFAVFSQGGANIGTYGVTLGGTHANWTLFTLTFSPPLSGTPDSVVFGATSSNPFNNVQIAGSTLTIDSVSFTGVSSQPAEMNGDFENWQSQTLRRPASWFYNGDQSGDGMQRTTDAHSGMYAIELTTYSKPNDKGNGTQVNFGSIGTGWYPNCHNGNCQEMGGYPFTNQVDTLTFWYKYVPSGTDTANVNVSFRKNGSQVGGNNALLFAASTYQYMELPLYANAVPDTVTIDFQSSSYSDTTLSFVGSDLKVDDIHFKSQLNTGINEFNNHNKLVLYPNPFKTFATLEVDPKIDLGGMQLRIYDVFGRMIKTVAVTEYKLTIAKDNLSGGMYFYEVINNSEILKTGKIIVE